MAGLFRGMTAALALMANERGDVRFVQHSMYYPVTDAEMDTARQSPSCATRCAT